MRAVGVMLIFSIIFFWVAWRLQNDGPHDTADVIAVRQGSRTVIATSSAKPSPGVMATKPQDGGSASPPAPPSLFRIAVTPMKPPPPPPKAGEHFVLVGIVMNGGQEMAFLRDEVDGRQWTAAEGGKVGRWAVKQIDGRCALLSSGRAQQKLCI